MVPKTPHSILKRSILFICGALFFTCSAQEESSKPLHIVYDAITGNEDVGVFDGLFFTDPYKVINEYHRYYQKPNFIQGTVTYNKQPYFNLDIKYDLFEDRLLVRHVAIVGAPMVQLLTPFVADFIIGNQRFVNIRKWISDEEITGFVTVLSEHDNLVLVKKHRKKRLKKIKQNIAYYEFKENSLLFLIHNRAVIPLRKEADLIGEFPDHKKQLKNLFAIHRMEKKKNKDQYFLKVISDFVPTISAANTGEL